MILALPRPLFFALLALAITGFILLRRALARRNTPARAMQKAMEEDATADPLRRWVQTAALIVMRNCDYGHLSRSEARHMLEHWWAIHGPTELQRQLDELAESGRPDNAWDLLRFIVVARMGAGAGFLSQQESWQRIRPVAERLQRAYDDWEGLGRAYVLARRQWRQLPTDGSEDDGGMMAIRDNIAHLQGQDWRQTPWALGFDATR
jgi:hypothetical protein